MTSGSEWKPVILFTGRGGQCLLMPLSAEREGKGLGLSKVGRRQGEWVEPLTELVESSQGVSGFSKGNLASKPLW